MKYEKVPRAMWLLFRRSYAKSAEKNLNVADGKNLMHKAKGDYKAILAGVDEFDSDSRFSVNIMSCAMVIAVLKQLKNKPTLEAMTAFYHDAMCKLDYDMAAMNNTVFTREYTLASGGEYCDCHYDHKGK